MNDRELLGLAAKAIGLKLRYNYLGGRDANQPWNPLEDDGDAFRLAVELDIATEPYSPERSTVAYIDSGIHKGLENVESPREWFDNDPYAATRRAIVRAAAEIGKQLQSLKGLNHA